MASDAEKAKRIEKALRDLADTIPSGHELLQQDVIHFFNTIRRVMRKQRTELLERNKEVRELTGRLAETMQALDRSLGKGFTP